ncbi:MAG: hypothetical protein LBT52_01070 [Clostridiales Family XIII bacterium]|jgi:hypothetical protein|nr:hypothetical protein [Clostridiales Family XIII bacterium]
MDDYYCFRKIKSTALVMIALVAVHLALSFSLGYYWNAIQARLAGIELTISGVPNTGDSAQGVIIYLLLFGIIALLAFITSPRRTNIWWRLILIVPLTIYFFSAYVEYEKISPIKEKFKDLYESLEYAIFVPYAAIAAITALYIFLVIILPAFRITQAFGWVAAVVAVLSYLVTAVFIVYDHTMTILEGAFGESDFYTYLAVFALDVVSYFFLISVLMTYCTIKREERWDKLEALAMEAEAETETYDVEEEAIYENQSPALSAYLRERVIPDIEDLKEHEVLYVDGYETYRRAPEPEIEVKPQEDRKEVKPQEEKESEEDPVARIKEESAPEEERFVKKESSRKGAFSGRKKSSKGDASADREKAVREDLFADRGKAALEDSLAGRGKTSREDSLADRGKAALDDSLVDRGKAAREDSLADRGKASREDSLAGRGKTVTEDAPIGDGEFAVDEEDVIEWNLVEEEELTEREAPAEEEEPATYISVTAEETSVIANRANRNTKNGAKKSVGNRSGGAGRSARLKKKSRKSR